VGFTFDEISGKVIAAAIEVHRNLGPGFVEAIYEEALKLELGKRNISYEAQKPIQIVYDGQVIGNHVLDLLIAGCLVVELKAIKALDEVHFAQVRSYLRATGVKVGLLMNFNTAALVIKRIVN
jgi:GxxExxY protein